MGACASSNQSKQAKYEATHADSKPTPAPLQRRSPAIDAREVAPQQAASQTSDSSPTALNEPAMLDADKDSGAVSAHLPPAVKEAEDAALAEASRLAVVDEHAEVAAPSSPTNSGRGGSGGSSGAVVSPTAAAFKAGLQTRRLSAHSMGGSEHTTPLVAIPEDAEVIARADSFNSARSYTTAVSHGSDPAIGKMEVPPPANGRAIGVGAAAVAPALSSLSPSLTSPRYNPHKLLFPGDDSLVPAELPSDIPVPTFWMPLSGTLLDDPAAHSIALSDSSSPSVMRLIGQTVTIDGATVSRKARQPSQNEATVDGVQADDWSVAEAALVTEEIAFVAAKPISGLTCFKQVTAEDLGFNFRVEQNMGDFEAGEHKFAFAQSKLPQGRFARGRYRMKTTFADNEGNELFAVKQKFVVTAASPPESQITDAKGPQ